MVPEVTTSEELKRKRARLEVAGRSGVEAVTVHGLGAGLRGKQAGSEPT
jgi:hypothetical protein